MFKKLILCATVAGLLFTISPTAVMAQSGPLTDGTPFGTSSTRAPVPPPGGYPLKYRLIFTTSAGYDADQTAISWYDNEVNDIANNLGAHTGGDSTVAGLTTWKMYGATAAEPNARINTGMLLTTDAGYTSDIDAPIYNFAGSKFADNNDDFWLLDGTVNITDGILDGLSYENGMEPGDIKAVGSDVYAAYWSGMTNNGNAVSGFELGAAFVARGIGYKTESEEANRWTYWGEPLAATPDINNERLGSDGHRQWINSYPRLRGISAVIDTTPDYSIWETATTGAWTDNSWEIDGVSGQGPGGKHMIVNTAGADVTVSTTETAQTLTIGAHPSGLGPGEASTVQVTGSLTGISLARIGSGSTLDASAGTFDAIELITAGTTTLGSGVVESVEITGGTFNLGAATGVEEYIQEDATATVNAGLASGVANVSVTNGEIIASGNINSTGKVVLDGGKLTATGAVTVSATNGVIIGNKPALAVQSGASLSIPTNSGALPSGALGIWNFDNDTANDTSGNNYHGVASGDGSGLLFSSDTPLQLGGKSVDLRAHAGQDSSIGFPDGDVDDEEDVFDFLDGDTGSHTISFWTKGAPQGDWGNWHSKTKTEADGWMIRQHTSNKTYLSWDMRGPNQGGGIGIAHGDDEWHHMAFVFEGNADPGND